MKRAPYLSPQWAARVCIDSLGVDVCAERCGVSVQIVYRWADIDADIECPMRHARTLDRQAYLKDGVSPFREIFEANAGETMAERVARQLERLADNLKGQAA